MEFPEHVSSEFYPCILSEFEYEDSNYFRIIIEVGFVTQYDEIFDKHDFFGDGNDWEEIVRKIIDTNPEIKLEELDFNSEMSTFLVDTLYKDMQIKLANYIKEICSDKNKVEEIVIELTQK